MRKFLVTEKQLDLFGLLTFKGQAPVLKTVKSEFILEEIPSVEFKGYTIEHHTFYTKYFIRGRYVSHGFVVIKDDVNVMPGGIWFESEWDAQEAIDTFIEAEGDAKKFWEMVQQRKSR